MRLGEKYISGCKRGDKKGLPPSCVFNAKLNVLKLSDKTLRKIFQGACLTSHEYQTEDTYLSSLF